MFLFRWNKVCPPDHQQGRKNKMRRLLRQFNLRRECWVWWNFNPSTPLHIFTVSFTALHFMHSESISLDCVCSTYLPVPKVKHMLWNRIVFQELLSALFQPKSTTSHVLPKANGYASRKSSLFNPQQPKPSAPSKSLLKKKVSTICILTNDKLQKLHKKGDAPI